MFGDDQGVVRELAMPVPQDELHKDMQEYEQDDGGEGIRTNDLVVSTVNCSPG